MNHIFKQEYNVTREMRNKHKKQASFLIWFTGLSGSGKSTIANALEKKLYSHQLHTYSLDGDNIRKGINKDLSFSAEDRTENIRRIAEVTNLFVDAGIIVLSAFISPYKIDRQNIKKIVGNDNFVEVYINTSLKECEKRDVKGLYKKAREGKILNFTGISAPYEVPESPDIEIKTEETSIKEATEIIFNYLAKRFKI
jgi:adenylylsulfate kinase